MDCIHFSNTFLLLCDQWFGTSTPFLILGDSCKCPETSLFHQRVGNGVHQIWWVDVRDAAIFPVKHKRFPPPCQLSQNRASVMLGGMLQTLGPVLCLLSWGEFVSDCFSADVSFNTCIGASVLTCPHRLPVLCEFTCVLQYDVGSHRNWYHEYLLNYAVLKWFQYCSFQVLTVNSTLAQCASS